MNKLKTGITCMLLFIFLAACQNNRLSDVDVSFESKDLSYTFRLPKDWETEEDYQNVFNKAAVFGAVDTNSISRMFIRTEQYEENVSEEKLKQAAKEQLEKYHEELTAEPEVFQANDYTGVYYKGEDLYKRKPVWLHLYFVAVGNQVVEFQFQSPKDQSDKKRQELFRQSVQSIAVESKGQESSAKESQALVQTPKKAENDQLSFQITGQKVAKQKNGETVLIIRYVCTNKGEEAIVPEKRWQKAVTVQQGAATLNVTDDLGEEVSYLRQAGSESLAASKTVEAAAVYSLPDETANIRLVFAKDLFPNKEALELTINE